MSDNNLSVRAKISASNEASPAIRRVIADIEKLKAVSKSFGASFGNVGRTGMESMSGFSRTAQNAANQMQGLANTSKSAARSYADDWRRATEHRLSESRRMYASLERMESQYQRRLERQMVTERRASGAGRSGSGRIPAPSVRSMVIGGAVAGAGVASAIRKRIEVQASEVRASMFGELSKAEVGALRKDFADRAGIKYGVGTSKVIDTAVEGLKAGIAKQFAGEFSDLALKAQAGLDVNPQEVGKLLGRLSTQMPWSKDRFSKILNSVAVANNATAADGNEIIEAMRRSLSALVTTKMTPEQLAALDSTGISLGVQPFKMGTFASFLTSQIAGADSATGRQGSDLSSAANALGFGGRSAMAKAMRERPMEAIQQILDNLAKMPEKLRTKVAKQIGGREWMDELLTLVLGRDKLKDVLKDIENRPGFLDKTALQKIRSMQGRWASIVAAFGLVWEKAGGGFEKIFDQVSDAFINIAGRFNFDTIKDHVDALIDGLREGFGLKDWSEAVKSLADNFDAGTIAKWRDFGKGFAEGIRDFASGLKTAFSALGFLAGKNPANAQEMGNLVAQLSGLAVALAVLAPTISVLAALTVGLNGLGITLGLIGGMPAAVALLSMFAARNQDVGVADDKIRRKDPKTGRRESYSDWQDRIATRKRLRNYSTPSGADPMFTPTNYTGSTDFSGRRRNSDLSENFNKFAGKIERAAFMSGGNGGGVQYAALGGGSGRGISDSGGGRKFIGGVPAIITNTPGTALPGLNRLGGNGIIRRDRIPTFPGAGGIVDPKNVPSFNGRGGSVADATGSGLSGNAFLAARRARLKKELDENPELKEQLAAVIDLENPGAGTAVAESLFNRSDMNGTTVQSGLGLNNRNRSFYGPVRRGQDIARLRELRRNPAKMAARMRQIDEALAGSNQIKGHTDQGSAGDPNYVSGGTGVSINRERFNDWGAGKWNGLRGHAASRAYREWQQRNVGSSGNAPVVSNVPSPADTVQNVPSPIRGDASLGLQGSGGGGPVSININGGSHDPESLAVLVQRRINEEMNWRTHDTSSEYT
ncbi:phage tail tape measure protein [Bradyrhizobium sp. URHC0002]